MADYKKLKPYILRWEGGFVNDPADAGGATNKGVTIATWRQTGSDKDGDFDIDVQDLKLMNEKDWDNIFKSRYWDKYRADEIKSQDIANICVDWLWCSGSWGITRVQRLLKLKEDGVVGAKTLQAINAQEPRKLFQLIKADREKFLHEIVARRPANKKFLRGWLNRLNSMKYEE